MQHSEGEPRAYLDGAAPRTGHVGARWWRLDIHAHSPASFDFGGLEGEATTGPLPSFEEWVRAYIDAGVDGIVVADHNSHEGVDAARDALQSLRDADPDLPPLVIFPGVELTLAGGFHALAVFEHTREASVIIEVLARCKFEGKRGRSDHVADVTVNAAAVVVRDLGGLLIPAHIDQRAGVLNMDRRELDTLTASGRVIAAEVADDGNVREAEARGWAPLLGSDAHHLTTDGAPDPASAKAPGTHLTLVKAEKLTIEGLRLALAEPSESIRRFRHGDHDSNEVAHDHIKMVTVKHKGIHRDFAFGPWMNCLIGGRGVGKSTLMELLRLALGRIDELPAKLATDLARFAPATDASERWWDEETEIEVIYARGGQVLRIRWVGALPAHPSLALWDGSGWEQQSGRVVDRAPVRVFSQKQIYELATKPQSFLQLVDDMSEIRKAEWEEQYEELRLRFKTERNKLRQLLAESEKADRLRGQLQEVRARLRHLEDLRASPEYLKLSQLETKTRTVDSVNRSSSDIEVVIAQQAASLRDLPVDADDSTEYLDYVASYERAAVLLDQAAEVVRSAREAWISTGAGQGWGKR